MRFLFHSLAIALTLSLMVGSDVRAQSTQPDGTEPAIQESAPDKKEPEVKKPELSDDQKELDKRLLGAWALVIDNTDAEITDELFQRALESCGTVPRVTGLDAEPGLKKVLPGKEEIRGQLIYFRTDQGLQRYETNPSRVFLLPDVRKAVNAQGRTIWQVSGQFAQFAIAFADARQGAGTLLMLEESRLFLKCESRPRQDG